VTCKVLDFGIAKMLDGRVDALETQAGTVFGTPRYMSPEQAQGRSLDARSDLYALGVLLYQMLAGRAPFVDDDAVVVMARHIKTPPPPLEQVAPSAHVPPALAAVVMRTLEKDPGARPSSARELASLLDEALRAPAPQPSSPSLRPPQANAAVSGELAAMVHDDLAAPLSPMSEPPRARGRALGLAASGLAVVLLAGLAARSLTGRAEVVIEARSVGPLLRGHAARAREARASSLRPDAGVAQVPSAAASGAATPSAAPATSAAQTVNVGTASVAASGPPLAKLPPSQPPPPAQPTPAAKPLPKAPGTGYTKFD
jgi:hypothetical protein